MAGKPQKFRVDTDKGSFIVEVEVPDEMATSAQTPDQKIRAQRAPGFDDKGPLSAAASGFLEGAVEGGRGFASEVVPGVGKAVLSIPGGILEVIKLAAATAGGTANLVKDPFGTISSLAEGASRLPAEIRQAIDDTMALAATDPEGFGNAVADLTANVGVGVATSKLLPTAVRPVADKAGKLMQTVGTKGEWPIRMVGAHQLGSGNPAGIAIMAAPEALVYGGKKLEQFGNKGIVRLGLPEQKFAKDIESALSKSLSSTPAKAALDQVDEAIAAEKKSAGAIRIASGKREAELKAAKKIEDKIAEEGLVPGDTRVTETVRAPGQSMSTTLSKPAPPTSDLTPLEQELLKRATSVKPVGQGPKATVTPAPSGAGGFTPEAQQSQMLDLLRDPEAVSGGRALERRVRDITPEVERRGVAPTQLDIPTTKSRNPLSALDDRLTDSDVQSLKQIIVDNPSISVEEATAEMLRQRALRSSTYRSEAGLSKLEQSALDRDIP